MGVAIFDEHRNFPSGQVGVEHSKFHLNVLPDFSPRDRERQTAPVPSERRFVRLAWEHVGELLIREDWTHAG
jgi:hypothetical protein